MADFTQRIMQAVFQEPFSRLQGSTRTVLNMHRTDRGKGPDPDGRCGECAESWPCPTVSTIANSLGVREDPED